MLEKYKGQRWVVGVSGGIDSLALLDMLRRASVDVVVSHVNYHKRVSSDTDEKIVCDYCSLYEIPFYVAHCPTNTSSNFQAYARDFRYAFYKQLVDEYQCSGVLLAHHKDDFIETALLRKKQGRQVDFLGIAKQANINGMLVKRPLLDLYKDDLVKYIHEHKLVYGQDESNFDNHYMRNSIRNIDLANLSFADKEIMYADIMQQNMVKESYIQGLKQLVNEHTLNGVMTYHFIFEKTEKMQVDILRYYFMQVSEEFYALSDRFYLDVIAFLRSKKAISTKKIRRFLILKEYEHLSLIEDKEYAFSYQLNKLEPLSTPYFQVKLDGSLKDGVSIKEEDFPLTIRSVKDGDKIALSFGRRSIKKYFIDNKVPYLERLLWPIILNKDNEVIFMCNLGSNITHFTNKPNLFVVK